MGPPLLARTGSFPCTVDARPQILASGWPHRQHLRRQESVLLLSAGGRVRKRVAHASHVPASASSRSQTFISAPYAKVRNAPARLFRHDAETSTRDACATLREPTQEL